MAACYSAAGQAVSTPSGAEWVSNRYCDFVGGNLSELRELDKISTTILAGCKRCFNWPGQLPGKLRVQVSPDAISRVLHSSSGSASLVLRENASSESRMEWLTRGLLAQFATWKGIKTPPPLWLVHATGLAGLNAENSHMRTLLFRRLQTLKVPNLAQRIQVFDRTPDAGWDYLIFLFLESGELEPAVFKQRLEQFWANGYDWTQLSLFFETRYPGLNGAELELLWKTFVSETLATESAVCLSESASLQALERLAGMELLIDRRLQVLAPDTWYLYRKDAVAINELTRKQSELGVLALSIHPYYFNACHSLDGILQSIEMDDLEAYRKSVRQFTQDMLDARQLSFETDRLLENSVER